MPILSGMLYQLPDKPGFIEYVDNSLKESSISNIQECYLMVDFNVTLLSGNRMLLDEKYSDSCSQAPPLVKKIYESLLFSLPPSVGCGPKKNY